MDDEKPTSWGALIPEFYFDLIGRVPPGTALTIFFAYQWVGSTGRSTVLQLTQEGKLGGIPFAAILTLLVLGGYSLGILLSPLGAMVGKLYVHSVWRAAEREFPDVKRAALRRYSRDIGTEHDAQPWRTINRLMHDELKTVHPHARVLLPKMAAEEALCRNLSAGVLIVMLELVIQFRSATPWKLMAELLVLAVALVAAARSRHTALVRRQFSYFRIASERLLDSIGA